jgi:hypothetical protein
MRSPNKAFISPENRSGIFFKLDFQFKRMGIISKKKLENSQNILINA